MLAHIQTGWIIGGVVLFLLLGWLAYWLDSKRRYYKKRSENYETTTGKYLGTLGEIHRILETRPAATHEELPSFLVGTLEDLYRKLRHARRDAHILPTPSDTCRYLPVGDRVLVLQTRDGSCHAIVYVWFDSKTWLSSDFLELLRRRFNEEALQRHPSDDPKPPYMMECGREELQYDLGHYYVQGIKAVVSRGLTPQSGGSDTTPWLDDIMVDDSGGADLDLVTRVMMAAIVKAEDEKQQLCNPTTP